MSNVTPMNPIFRTSYWQSGGAANSTLTSEYDENQRLQLEASQHFQHYQNLMAGQQGQSHQQAVQYQQQLLAQYHAQAYAQMQMQQV